MKAIKRFLKKILPPSMNIFLKEINRIQREQSAEIERLNTLLIEANEQTNSLLLELQRAVADLSAQSQKRHEDSQKSHTILNEKLLSIMKNQPVLNEKLLSIMKNQPVLNEKLLSITKSQPVFNEKLLSIMQRLPNSVLYDGRMERDYLKKFNFYDILHSDNFIEKYKSLIKNLDKESKTVINKIIANILKVENTSYGDKIDLYSEAEKQELRETHGEFQKQILQLQENLFSYKHFLLPVRHFEPSVFYYRLGLDYVKDLPYFKNKDIIDAGAFIGDSALILAPLTDKKVYAFEPVQENCVLMQETLRLNNVTNVVPESIALGAEPKNEKIYISGSSSNFLDTNADTEGQTDVKVTTLDEYAALHGLDVGLIKVDIEGYEQDFLRGAEQTIRERKPILLLSIYHTADDFFHIKPMLESWDLGYNFKIFKPRSQVIFETMLIAQV